jgi:uncharacterized transporter YbjL
MSPEAVLSAIDSRAVLVAGIVVVAVPLLTVFAVVGHVAMKPVRKTRVGQWASSHTEARMDRIRAAWSARKGTKAVSSDAH